MDPKPTVLIVSNSNTKPTSIIKLITKQATNSCDISGNTITQPWTIKTKYYTTDIHLVGFNDTVDKLDKDAVYINSIEALIVHMDTNKATGLEQVNKWTELMNELSIQPEIKILLTNYCNDKTVISKDEANLWCLDKGFELIELFPTTENNEEEHVNENNADEVVFGIEKVGVERVIEALENNLWSNMQMSDDNNEEGSNQEAETDQFMELFSNLMTMKSSITSLPSNVRKQYAEQMVTAFWNAIGGDDDEIADL